MSYYPWDCRCAFRMNLGFLQPRRKRRHLPCWPTRLGISGRRMFPRPRERSIQPSWEKSPMPEFVRPAANAVSPDSLRGASGPSSSLGMTDLWVVCILLALIFPLFSCSSKPDANTLVMIIESSPTNLDPRVGIDAHSERIYTLFFHTLLDRHEHLN